MLRFDPTIVGVNNPIHLQMGFTGLMSVAPLFLPCQMYACTYYSVSPTQALAPSEAGSL